MHPPFPSPSLPLPHPPKKVFSSDHRSIAFEMENFRPDRSLGLPHSQLSRLSGLAGRAVRSVCISTAASTHRSLSHSIPSVERKKKNQNYIFFSRCQGSAAAVGRPLVRRGVRRARECELHHVGALCMARDVGDGSGALLSHAPTSPHSGALSGRQLHALADSARGSRSFMAYSLATGWACLLQLIARHAVSHGVAEGTRKARGPHRRLRICTYVRINLLG
ncbi:hypothetical protein EDC01DRAFT_320361 [Geopyxis carbonaria]|nr:hypothetical protein EDC01DRAFT_320361 [Geopyxis carbonaria]